MKPENFIGFFTSLGFFIGLFLCMFVNLAPSEFILYPSIVALFFFLGSHICIMNYVDASKESKIYFDKRKHEEINDYLIDSLAQREHKMDTMIQIEREKILLKKPLKQKKHKNERAKTKAA